MNKPKDVFELHSAFIFQGTVHQTGDRSGTLFASLESAQAAGQGPWIRRERKRAWDNPSKDIIVQRSVKP